MRNYSISFGPPPVFSYIFTFYTLVHGIVDLVEVSFFVKVD